MKKHAFLIVLITASIIVAGAIVLSTPHDEKGGGGLSQFIGTEINIPEGVADNGHKSARMIVFSDTATCATCMLKRIAEWKEIFPESLTDTSKTEGRFEMLFIFEPRTEDSARYVQELERAQLPYKVFSDFNGEFRRVNPGLTDDRRLHTFLLDGQGRVVLAGNPRENIVLREVYQKYIEFLTVNNGILSNAFAEEVEEYIRQRSKPANGLFVENRSIEIGDVAYGSEQTVTFVIFNITESEIEIESLITDCDCMEASALPTIIKPGRRSIITVSFTADSRGRIFRDLFVKVRGYEQETQLTVTGNSI